MTEYGALRAELDGLRAQLAAVTECNESMREAMRDLRAMVAMPAQGEGAVLGAVARKLAAVTAERDAARAECERLRKLFDDAGAGEHNVLALIDHYQDEALNATSELAQARQLVALLEDRISDVEDRDDDARTVCEWAATVALKSTDVHNAATRYLTGVQSPLRTRLAEVERERDAVGAQWAEETRHKIAAAKAERERDEAVRHLRYVMQAERNAPDIMDDARAFLARVSR